MSFNGELQHVTNRVFTVKLIVANHFLVQKEKASFITFCNNPKNNSASLWYALPTTQGMRNYYIHLFYPIISRSNKHATRNAFRTEPQMEGFWENS